MQKAPLFSYSGTAELYNIRIKRVNSFCVGSYVAKETIQRIRK